MRIATCLRGQYTVMGSRHAMAIAEGWTGDLDQVVGASADGQVETLGDQLQHVLHNFEVQAPTRRSTRSVSAPMASRQE